MSTNNTVMPSTISYDTTYTGSNSDVILPDDYEFKADEFDSHW